MIGIDVVNIDRFRTVLDRSPWLEAGLFTAGERSYCREKADPQLHLASTFAAKEAVVKAGRLGSIAATARRIEVTRDPRGRPMARLEGGATFDLSISHDAGLAVAIAFKADLGSPPDRAEADTDEDLAWLQRFDR